MVKQVVQKLLTTNTYIKRLYPSTAFVPTIDASKNNPVLNQNFCMNQTAPITSVDKVETSRE